MRKALVRVILLFFIICVGYNYSFCKDVVTKEEVINTYKGEIKLVTVDNPTRVVINNPVIADVISVSKDEMIISAKEAGTTNLIWWDAKGQHVSQLEVLLENMNPVKERIDNILKQMSLFGVITRSLDSEGKVLILGNVKTAQDIERLNVALTSLKGKIINVIQIKEEETVVGIDVQVLELDKDATSTLGFSWPGSNTLTEVGSPGIAAAGTTWGRLFRVLNESREAFTLKLDALVQDGSARILSQPRLSCQSGKEAELLVGGEKPILTTTVAATTGATGTEVEYKEFGIKLKIKPVVTEDKKIKLALNMEVSEVGTAETLGSSSSPTAKAYPLTKRSASTELFLKDGQTMAIGGLKKQKSEEDIRKTPFLGDVPLLGLAFKKKTTRIGGGQGERGDVELFITLTTSIVKEEAVKPEVTPPAKEEKPAKVEDKAKVPATSEAAKKKDTKPEVTPPAKEEKPSKDKTNISFAKPKEGVKKDTKPKEEPSSKKITAAKDESKPKVPYSTIKTSPVTSYIYKVTQQIRRNFIYPWAAKEGNMEGSVKLAIRLSYAGQLLDVAVKQSSGYAILDENAVNIVKKSAPYPPFPPEMKQKELRVDLPIVYKAK